MQFHPLQNGFPYWTEHEIETRDRFIIANKIAMQSMFSTIFRNPVAMKRIEGPVIMPEAWLSPRYTGREEEVYDLESPYGSILRPETTPVTFEYIRQLMRHPSLLQTPFCIWQAGLSFRRELNAPESDVRLKQFYQQEFQIVMERSRVGEIRIDHRVVELLTHHFCNLLGTTTQWIKPTVTPRYADDAIDIEAYDPCTNRYVEIVSITIRNDLDVLIPSMPDPPVPLEQLQAVVLEIAIGLDRLVHIRSEVDKT